jgi:hypothetical protein
VVIGVAPNKAGRPICSENWPGDVTKVKALLPIVTRRDRFGESQTWVVADRGMIRADTIAGLQARCVEYILGVREQSASEVRQVVLSDRQPISWNFLGTGAIRYLSNLAILCSISRDRRNSKKRASTGLVCLNVSWKNGLDDGHARSRHRQEERHFKGVGLPTRCQVLGAVADEIFEG